MSLKLPGHAYGTLIVDVASRFATRNLVINMERGQIQWRWEEGVLRVYEAEAERWIQYEYPVAAAAEGYNKNIIEDMYTDEVRSFVDAAKGHGKFPHILADDIKVLKLLAEVEK